MTRFCLICSIVLFFASCTNKKTDLEELNLKSKVKSIKENYFNISDSGDIKGEEGTSMLIDSNEEILSKETLVRFNKKGMKDSIVLSSSLSTYVDLFEYENDKLISRKSYDSIMLYSNYKYIYDDKDNLILVELYDANNTLLEETKIEYSKNKEHNRIFVPFEKLYYSVEKTLDDFNNVLEKKTLSEDKKQIDRQVSKYNSNNKLTESILFNSNDIEYQKLTYTYDEKNNETECIILNMPSNNIIVKYNYSYVYDEKNNWTKQITKVEGVTDTYSTTREITYY